MNGLSAITFEIGGRRLLQVRKRLDRVQFGLADILGGIRPELPDIGRDSDGVRIYSAPLSSLGDIASRYAGCAIHDRYRYRRCYIDMRSNFAGYLSKFSSRTRSTLKRKSRKIADLSGGVLDVRAYSTPEQVDEFLTLAADLSARTYQQRLMDAGLPADASFRDRSREMAAHDSLRCFLLFIGGKPVSYLYLPARDGVLIYEYLGYDSAHADLSPGTVLQMEALDRLFAERRYRFFDFTEGEGSHKQLFATDAVDCATVTVLRGTPANRALLGALTMFDGAVSGARMLSERLGTRAALRRMMKR